MLQADELTEDGVEINLKPTVRKRAHTHSETGTEQENTRKATKLWQQEA